ncbi:MAG: LolA family protein [Acetobacteraceae bacterium]
MIRRRLLLALPPALLAAPAPAQRAAPPARAADIARVEAYLNSLTTLRARFLQVAEGGATAEGTALIWRPGRMRFDYDPPEPTLIVAWEGQVMHFDRELNSPSIVPAAQTPLAVLLRPRIALSGDITVGEVERSGGFLRLTIRRTGAEAEGSLTLVLEENPLALRQWQVVDAQRQRTTVTLTQVETGVRLDPNLFAFNDPRFFEWEAERRPRR